MYNDRIERKLTPKEKKFLGDVGEKITNDKIEDILFNMFKESDFALKWYIHKGRYQTCSPYERYKRYQKDGIDGLFHFNDILVQVKTRQYSYYYKKDIYLELGRKINGKERFNAWYSKDIDLLLYYFYSFEEKRIKKGYAIILDEFKKEFNSLEKIQRKYGLNYNTYVNPIKIKTYIPFNKFPENLFFKISKIIRGD